MRARSLLPVALVHLGLAIAWTWPAVLDPVHALPGAERTDLWDSLWSFWYVQQRVFAGQLPLHADGILNHPDGGLLWVTDLLNSALILPLLAVTSLPVAWTLLVLGHQVFAGIASFGLCRAVTRSKPSAWLGSVVYANAPLLLAHIHNGASEAVGGGWLAAAAWSLWGLREEGGWRKGILTALLVGLCAIGQWYAGVCIGILAILLIGEAFLGGERAVAVRLMLALSGGILLALPVAGMAEWASTASTNLVGIKTPKELMAVRRTIGPADPVGFFAPGDYRSPDFRELSRYGEQYMHCTYLGWVAILTSIAGLWRDRRRSGIWWIALFVGMILACGPVLARYGSPVILPGRRAVPLPYLLLEKLPGFSGLSLLWRLAQLPVLALSVLSARAIAGHARESWLSPVLSLLFLSEIAFLSPMKGLPYHSDASASEPIQKLAEAPDGAVMNFPLVGGRPYLYEQTLHHKPLAGTLNFPNSRASMKVWKAVLDHLQDPPEQLREIVATTARGVQLRYLVVHSDPFARPDQHDEAVRAIKAAFSPMAESSAIRVYQLW